MQTVILAAGKGTRLGNITKDTPKCLLRFGDITILERQINVLNKNGIKDIIVVTGFKKENIMDVLKNRVQYIVNDIYEESNSSYSLYLARKSLESGWLHINCDLLFTESILKKIMQKENENSVVVEFDIKKTDDQERVRIKDGIIVEMSKEISFEKADGKTIGMARFSRTGAKVILEYLEKEVNSGHKNRWFFSIVADVLSKVGFRAVSTDGVPWAEIDTPEDLKYARQLFDTHFK